MNNSDMTKSYLTSRKSTIGSTHRSTPTPVDDEWPRRDSESRADSLRDPRHSKSLASQRMNSLTISRSRICSLYTQKTP